MTSIEDFPTDRELSLAEMQSLIDTLRTQAANSHTYTKAQWRRDRTFGWILTVALVAGVGWIGYAEAVGTAKFQRQVQAACVDRNAQQVALRSLYTSLTDDARKTLATATTGPLADPKVREANLRQMQLLDNAAQAMKPLPCDFH